MSSIINSQLIVHLHSSFTNICTFIKPRLKFTLKLDGSYMFRSTIVIRELATGSG